MVKITISNRDIKQYAWLLNPMKIRSLQEERERKALEDKHLGFGKINENENVAKELGYEDMLGNHGTNSIDFARNVYLCWDCVKKVIDIGNNDFDSKEGIINIYVACHKQGALPQLPNAQPRSFSSISVDRKCARCGKVDKQGQKSSKYGMSFKKIPASIYSIATNLGGFTKNQYEKLVDYGQTVSDVKYTENEAKRIADIRNKGGNPLDER